LFDMNEAHPTNQNGYMSLLLNYSNSSLTKSSFRLSHATWTQHADKNTTYPTMSVAISRKELILPK
jgi:hypothetical protein